MSRDVEPTQSERPMPGSVADVRAGLEALKDHGFITDWWRVKRTRWLIKGGEALYGPFTTREAFGFVEGCRAMGAAC